MPSLSEIDHVKATHVSTCCDSHDLAAWHRLSVLPDAVGQLSHLQKLCLSHNAVVGLSSCIGQLTNLQHLDMRSNSLKELPQVRGASTFMCDALSLCCYMPVPHLLPKAVKLCLLSLHEMNSNPYE